MTVEIQGTTGTSAITASTRLTTSRLCSSYVEPQNSVPKWLLDCFFLGFLPQEYVLIGGQGMPVEGLQRT